MVLSTSAPTSLNLDQQIMDFVAHSILWRWNSSCKILCNIVIQWRHSNKFYSKFLQRAVMMKNTIGPTQVKCGLLISSIFYVMNFRHFLEMLEFNLFLLKNCLLFVIIFVTVNWNLKCDVVFFSVDVVCFLP